MSTTRVGSGLTCKRFAMDKRTSLFVSFVSEEEKRFIMLTPGPNVLKLFMFAIYKCL